MNSGIMPNLIRSSVRAMRAQRVLVDPRPCRCCAPKPRPRSPTRRRTISSTPLNAPRADEQDVGRVDLDQLLLRAVARAVGRDRRCLPSRILSSACCTPSPETSRVDGRPAALARDLVDLVDADDAAAGLLGVVAGVAVQRLDDAVDVLADVAGLGQRGRVRHRERHVQLLGQRLGQQGLARSRSGPSSRMLPFWISTSPALPCWPMRL